MDWVLCIYELSSTNTIIDRREIVDLIMKAETIIRNAEEILDMGDNHKNKVYF